MLKRIDCPIFYVLDMEKSVEFYRALGFETREESDGYCELELGGTKLALNSKNKDNAGRQTMILASDDIEADWELISKRYPVIEPIGDPGYGLTFAFADPSGNKLEVI